MSKKIPKQVAAQIAAAESHAANDDYQSGDDGTFNHDDAPSIDLTVKLDPANIAYCAGLDASDVDNAKRLNLHYGSELIVMAQEGSEKPPFAAWTGPIGILATGRNWR